MKKVTVNINNKVVYTSLLILGLVLLGGIVFATLGSIPNPGHSLNQIQKCSANEILKMNADGTDWECASNNLNNINCRFIMQNFASHSGQISCSSDEVLTGGACRDNGGNILLAAVGTTIYRNSYLCNADQNVLITVVCCKGILN